MRKYFPFLNWFDNLSLERLRADLISGLTIALVLVPQSMAYAQLAGLPAIYGLYAAFLPPIVAAMFGSSHHMATGPTALAAMMTAACMEPLATAGSEAYILYAILLALIAGVFQIMMGIARLGIIVNFLSHPIVSGFSSAAAIIIATSQLSKMFGVDVDKADYQFITLTRVLSAALQGLHYPTLMMAMATIAIILLSKKVSRKIPGVLVAVLITTLISWWFQYEQKREVDLVQLPPEAQNLIVQYNGIVTKIEQYQKEIVEMPPGPEGEIAILQGKLKLKQANEEAHLQRNIIRAFLLVQGDAKLAVQSYFEAEENRQHKTWRFQVSNLKIDTKSIQLTGGGAVVGNIPSGLPVFQLPDFSLIFSMDLLIAGMLLALVTFSEASTIARVLASKSEQRIDLNQELIGQGLSKIASSLTQGFIVSGSFMRSALSYQAGSISGMAQVFSSLIIGITLIAFTPLLYHLPQATLASIIILAVISLVDLQAFKDAFKVRKFDGFIFYITFVVTLIAAPNIQYGLLIGIGLNLIFFIAQKLQPGIENLSLPSAGGYFVDLSRTDQGECEHIAMVRFRGSLNFANASYLEDHLLNTVADKPKLKHIILVCHSMLDIDASGIHMLETQIKRLRSAGYDISICELRQRVETLMQRSGLLETIGSDRIFKSAQEAVEAIYESTHKKTKEENCPLVFR